MKKFLSFLLVVVVTFIGSITVSAEDYKINVEVSDLGNVTSYLEMIIDGQFDFNNNRYYIWFLNENDPAPTPGKGDDSNSSIIGNWYPIYDNDGKARIADKSDWYMLKGYDYAYIEKLENSTNQYSLVSSKIKIEKPELLPNKKRYSFSSVSDGDFSTYVLFPCKGNIGNHKLYTKVGKITNTSLLREYNNNKFDNLFTYAKNDNSGKLGSCEVGNNNSNICKTYKLSEIEAGSYYYVYFYMDDPLYRDLSSVIIAVGKASNEGSNYISYLETVDIGSSNEVFTNDVVANPKTADFKLIIIVSLIVITILASIIGRKKLIKIVKK